MIGDNARKIIANTSKSVRVSRAVPISLYAEIIHEDDVLKGTPGAYFTNLLYSIRYTPCEIYGPKQGKQFLIKADLLDKIETKGHRFVNFEDFCNSDKYKEVVPFLLEFTNISQELFDVAQANPTLDIPIAFDVLKYIRVVSHNKAIKEAKQGTFQFTFLTDEAKELAKLIEQDKVICRKNSKENKLKGVINK